MSDVNRFHNLRNASYDMDSCCSLLLTLNNKLLRILKNKPYHSPTKDPYFNYNTLPIPDLHRQQILLFFHKFIHRKKFVYQMYLVIILY